MIARVAIFLLLIVLGFFCYVRFTERRTVFVPLKPLTQTPAEAGLTYDDVVLKTRDGVRLHGWFLPAPAQTKGAPTVIFLHGNAGNIGGRIGKLKELHRLGVNVLIIDYRGYGRSEGAPSEEGIYRDAEAAFDYVAARTDLRQDRIIAYGASLGGAPAIELAIRRPLNGIILDSTFTSSGDMAKRIVPFVPRFMLKTRMDNLKKISKLRIPKLFIHSPHDETVPYQMGLTLYRAAPAPKEFLKVTGGHNDAYQLSQVIFSGGIRAFLRKFFSE